MSPLLGRRNNVEVGKVSGEDTGVRVELNADVGLDTNGGMAWRSCVLSRLGVWHIRPVIWSELLDGGIFSLPTAVSEDGVA